jgi:hypothetical protein
MDGSLIDLRGCPSPPTRVFCKKSVQSIENKALAFFCNDKELVIVAK